MFEGERVNSEYTLLRNWMEMWLNHLLWFARLHLDPDPSFHDLFNPPVVCTTYKRNDRYDLKEGLRRFGLLWRMYDLGEGT